MSIHNDALLNTTGISDLQDAGIVLIHTKWNNLIVDELVKGCKEEFKEKGIPKLTTVEVPGAVEIPFTCKRYFEATKDSNKQPDAFIVFGCVIRGETPHFDYVCQAVTDGVTQLNLTLPVPVIFGVLTVENIEQAKERLGGTHGHKGKEAAITALQMIAFNRSLEQ